MKRSLQNLSLAAMLVAGMIFAGPVAKADLLLGQTLNVTYRFPDFGTIYGGNNADVVVGPGFELFNWPADNVFDVDISDTSILIDYNHLVSSWTGASFNGISFFDVLSAIPAFTSVSIDPITNLVGFGAGNITFDADRISLNWQGLSFNTDTVVKININGGAPGVPEPTSLLLLGSGLLGFGRLARRRIAGRK